MYTIISFPNIAYQRLISTDNCRAHRFPSPCHFIFASVCLFGQRSKNMPSCLSPRSLLVVLNRLFNHRIPCDKPTITCKILEISTMTTFQLRRLETEALFSSFRYQVSPCRVRLIASFNQEK